MKRAKELHLIVWASGMVEFSREPISGAITIASADGIGAIDALLAAVSDVTEFRDLGGGTIRSVIVDWDDSLDGSDAIDELHRWRDALFADVIVLHCGRSGVIEWPHYRAEAA